MLGKTPLKIKLSAKNTHYIVFVKEGYEKKTYITSSSVGGEWIILDILFGVLPVIIEAAMGSWYSFDNNYVGVYLERNTSLIDSISNTEKVIGVSSSESEDKFPSFLSVKLKDDNEEIILDGKVSLMCKSSGWDKSLLSAKGIWGFSDNFNGSFNEMSIRLSKYDVIYMKVDLNTVYRVEVVQEILNNLSLEFTKL